MSEFKSGDIVKCGDSYYTYVCVHPTEKHLSIVIDLVTYSTGKCFYTDQLIPVPKTHVVNGFEVPVPLSEDEFKVYSDDAEVFVFSHHFSTGFDRTKIIYVNEVAVKCGLIFKSKSDIKKNIAALQGIDPYTVE